jgi:hypothetical protein
MEIPVLEYGDRKLRGHMELLERCHIPAEIESRSNPSSPYAGSILVLDIRNNSRPCSVQQALQTAEHLGAVALIVPEDSRDKNDTQNEMLSDRVCTPNVLAVSISKQNMRQLVERIKGAPGVLASGYGQQKTKLRGSFWSRRLDWQDGLATALHTRLLAGAGAVADVSPTTPVTAKAAFGAASNVRVELLVLFTSATNTRILVLQTQNPKYFSIKFNPISYFCLTH